MLIRSGGRVERRVYWWLRRVLRRVEISRRVSDGVEGGGGGERRLKSAVGSQESTA